jgi:KaiC/GvpD/RAD55 family RecA-like ATPase
VRPSIAPTSIALSGPDGSGKSILALHVASKYWHDAPDGEKPICLYVSTDLSYEQAARAWKAFGLNLPKKRLRTIHQAYGDNVEKEVVEAELKLQLVEPTVDHRHDRQQGASTATPTAVKVGTADATTGVVEELSLNQLLIEVANPNRTPAIYYIDLQKQSAGDDWQFLNRLLGILDTCASRPNLLVIDAVEGLEVLVGRRDAFGELRSRRSRIAQLIRTAKRSGHHAHLVFVIEEMQPNRRLPEQFVTDMVVRLRQRKDAEYLVRTIEIEKCRGYAHDRGEHQFVIRSGRGAPTGRDSNVDEPEIKLGDSFLAHLLVLKSLHAWNAELRRLREAIPDSTSFAPRFFNLELLESLLGRRSRANKGDGLVTSGSITLLLGDTGTFKSRLARNFLLQGLVPPLLEGNIKPEIANEILNKPADGPMDSRTEKSYGVAVLFSTEMVDKDRLLEKFDRLLGTGPARVIGAGPNGLDVVKKLVLCRRLGVRYESSAEFIAAVRLHIRKARQILIDEFGRDLRDEIRQKLTGENSGKGLHATHFERPLDDDQGLAAEVAKYRALISSRNRSVIDDLSLFLTAHP